MRVVGATLAWLALWYMAGFLEYAPNASLWFPPSALSLALYAVYGRSAMGMVAVAAFFAVMQNDLLDGVPFSSMLKSAIGNALIQNGAYGGLAYALMRVVKRDSDTPLIVAGLPFLLLTPIAAAVASGLGTANLVFAGILARDEALDALFPWWIGDTVGLYTLAVPLMLVLQTLPGKKSFWIGPISFDPIDPWRLLICGGIVIGVFAVVMAVYLSCAHRIPVSYVAYAMILPTIAFARSEAPVLTMILIALVEALFIVGASLFGLGASAMEYQGAMLALAAAGYVSLSVPTLRAQTVRLRRLAAADSLTGVLNRRAFLSLAEREIYCAKHRGETVAVMTFDIDHFHAIHERHGVAVGNEVLVHVAHLVATALRAKDFVGRVGDREFSIMLPQTDVATAQGIAERLRLVVAERKIAHQGETIGVTVSFGLSALLADEGDDLLSLIKRADRALYIAKSRGRNCVAVV